MKYLGDAGTATDDERWVRARLASAPVPQPSPEFLAALTGVGQLRSGQPRSGQRATRRLQPLGSQRPPGRADGAGPGRRIRGRYIAAAGLAASVVVGLGSGGLGSSGGGRIANPPVQPLPSSVVETVSVAGVGTAPTPIRPLMRPSARTVLSVVYRRP